MNFTDFSAICDNFSKWYDLLYNDRAVISDDLRYNALDEYDNMVKSSDLFRLIRNKFNSIRNDVISSDREVIAYMLALYDCNLIDLSPLVESESTEVVKAVAPEYVNF